MPTPPIYNGRQVQSTAMPGIRVNTQAPVESFGGGQSNAGVFDAAKGLAGEAQKIYVEEKQKQDDVATQDAWTKAMKAKQARLYDPKEGAFAKRGKDAFNLVDTVGTAYRKDLDDIEGTLANDDQRALFQKMRQREEVDFDGQLTRHTFQESQAFDDQTTKAAVQTTRDEAVLNYQDPERRAQALRMQEATLMAHAGRMGFDAVTTQAYLQGEKAKTHAAVVERMIDNGQDLAASQYYRENKDQFGSLTGNVEKALQEGSLRGESQRQTDALMKENLSLGQALERARGIEEPKLRDAVVDRIKGEFALKDAAKRDAEEQRSLRLTNLIEQTKDVKAIPAAQWAQLPMDERKRLTAYANDLAAGRQVEANGQEYYDLKTMAAQPDTRNSFLQTDLMKYKGRVRDTELKELIDIQADARKGGKEGQAKMDGFLSDMQVVEGTMKELGIKKDSDDGVAFLREIDRRAAQFSASSGKKPSNEDLRSMANELGVKVVTDKGWLWNTRKSAYQLGEGDKIEAVEPDQIPKKDRKEIETYLRGRGAKITDTAVSAFYTELLRKRRGN